MAVQPVPVLSIPALAGEEGLVHGFSTLELGSMREERARAQFARLLELDVARLTVAAVVHGVDVLRVDEPLGDVDGVDILVTDQPGLGLMERYADCYPVVLYDRHRHCLALAHAGWRGTAAAVSAVAVSALAREFGSHPRDLVAGVGPGICGNCYEVGAEVAASFPDVVLKPAGAGKATLDLASANRLQLIDAGVEAANVHIHGACTRECARLPSHRRDADGRRFAALVALKD